MVTSGSRMNLVTTFLNSSSRGLTGFESFISPSSGGSEISPSSEGSTGSSEGFFSSSTVKVAVFLSRKGNWYKAYW